MDSVDEKFTGQVRDTETFNDFFNARYYTAPLMRFLSSDPGNAGADPTDPQTWNAYAYVRNNPLIYTDPSGENLADFFGGLLSTISAWFGGGGDGSCDVDFCTTGYGVPDQNPSTSSADTGDSLSFGEGPSGGTPVFSVTATGVANRNPKPVSTPPSQTLQPAKTGIRNCTVNPASAGQYVVATTQVALLTGQFFSGLGSANQTFGPNTATSQVMAQSGPVQDVLNEYFMTGRTSNLYTFGATGYVAASANPVAQFVGSFRWTISPTNGGINLTLKNTTSFKSLTYDKGPQ